MLIIKWKTVLTVLFCIFSSPPLGNGWQVGEGRRNEVTLKIMLQHVIFWNGRRFHIACILQETFSEVDIKLQLMKLCLLH